MARSHSQSLKICIVLAVFQEEDKLQELLETNPPIAVDIRLLDNLVRLFVAQLGRGVDLRRIVAYLLTDLSINFKRIQKSYFNFLKKYYQSVITDWRLLQLPHAHQLLELFLGENSVAVLVEIAETLLLHLEHSHEAEELWQLEGLVAVVDEFTDLAVHGGKVLTFEIQRIQNCVPFYLIL